MDPSRWCRFAISLWAGCSTLAAATTNAPPDDAPSVVPGHSLHGEAFNEGPRQPAYLMPGMPAIRFPVTTTNELAQKFFTQGVGQLHGFWYLEAERSFRQAAVHDTHCAMAYWGSAMANIDNAERSAGFIKEAVHRKASVSHREQLWIEALAEFRKDPKKDEKERHRDLTRALENLVYEFPEDIEAKAFLAVHIWQSAGKGLPISSAQAVESLLKEVFAAQPMHPAHHYRIHLWDGENDPTAIRALPSAARAGQSGPGIAHLWHMPGHTFNKLKRYEDMAWQQEASVRVDNAQIMRDRLLPDQIHNYAHNSEWLAQTLNYVGRVRDAVALTLNMIEMPRHPKLNALDLKEDGTPYASGGNTASHGRRRLMETLLRYELWDDAIALGASFYLEPTGIGIEQARRARLLGVARFARTNLVEGRAQMAALEAAAKGVRTARAASVDAAEAKSKADKKSDEETKKAMTAALESHAEDLKRLDEWTEELRVLESLADGKSDGLTNQVAALKSVSKERLSLLWLALGQNDQAEKLAKEAVEGGTNQVQILANHADVLWRCGKTNEAKEAFAKLRERSAFLDLDMPVFRRLGPLAAELKLPDDWRVAAVKRDDTGERPDLATLGPFRWAPVAAPQFTLPTADGKTVSLRDYRGRPVLVVFYLGHGCLHCLEQLNALAPAVADFKAAGVELLAVSADSVAALGKTQAQAKAAGGFPFPLVADASREVFRRYRAYDGFEEVPLHGLFLIDGDGLVRWQDIGHEPFNEVKFLVAEAKRQLFQVGDKAKLPKRLTASATP